MIFSLLSEVETTLEVSELAVALLDASNCHGQESKG